jgi:hypothetical protein
MQKSFWYLMAWSWKNGQAKLLGSHKSPHTLDLTAGYSDHKQRVPRLDPKDSFRTLGIYISSSGSQTRQARVLRQYAEEYKIRVSMSNLSQEAAYCSYIQYIRPKLIYPLPCSALTQTQCRHIQAPALAGLLPKLHLNQHTPHAIIFGEQRFGGLNLPDLYTDQGCGQLRLLLGHLRRRDETGQLILIAISHLQLQVGSAKPFFTLPYPHYARWIDSTWLTAIWKHTVQLQMQVEVEHHWLPTLTRENDIMLMDLFMTLNFSHSQLKLINNCRLFLQVLTLSDITSADGKTLLPNYTKGIVSTDRTSSLKWPEQTRPPPSAWTLWKTALAHISTSEKLSTPLGRWTDITHLRWTWFHHGSQPIVYNLTSNNQWLEYHPITTIPGSSIRTTRQTKVWFSLSVGRPSNPDISQLLSATIYQDPLFDDYLFYSNHSLTAIPTISPQAISNSVWGLDTSLHILADTPEFYQRLLGPLPNITDPIGLEIAHHLELETMVTCSDGSFYPDSHTGSHGWVLASADKAILLQGAGPGDGHPKLTSSYRSELGGLLAVLYLIHRICHHYQVQGGQLKYHCDNRGVLKNVFSSATPGIAPYLQADADLVMEARHLLSIIPVTIIAEWVKGHYSGKDREFKHDLNEIADSLATSFNSVPHPNFKPRLQPIAHPHYGARILYEGSTITNKLRSLMAQALHRPALVSHLIRKNKWEERTFHLVHWDAHEMAFKRLTSSCQITTAKLIHDLVNTNVQNYRYYNISPKCPCCLTVDETFHHVLSCSSTTAAEYREQALQQLQKDLKSINTPSEVVDALSHGKTMWLKRQIDSDCTVRASTVGSLKGTDILLTMAFNEQFHKIGWHNLFNGRISKLWGRAVLQLTKSSYSSLSTTWSAQTILYLWKYTRSIWINRNQVVHGKTDQEMANKIRESIHTKVRQLYETFQSTPIFILSRHHYLFTN